MGIESWAALALAGVMIGSFLNVVIHRLPIMIERAGNGAEGRYDLAWPPSACPGCGRPVRALENVPVVSFLLLRGRCAGCGRRIGWRYPAVEILGGLLPVAFGLLLPPGPVAALSGALFVWLLLAITVTDLESGLIPDALSLTLLWSGLLVSACGGPFVGPADSVRGAAAGYLALRVVEALAERAYGRPALGRGDAKLLGALGAWVGWQGLGATLFLGSSIGALTGIALIAARRLDRRAAIPFGPFLAAGGVIALLFGKDLATVLPALPFVFK
ncbi:prepilin peptidase [Azospirillum rugosum]|uniref:Prepilin leader peptidase/N-methyltransferase n=1 Tax=Azospirillum rugosum TaxID=416170 RepID=A0ABS4ST91_9PROT|nr:A24 family peptidase [Azospirillum rugosum]MBP2295459.1 leader peptidase (prepilin peptidase)/N-methyltransferase [Azospirillum rugosum]MDQ0528338.1 leader peptidase (prepilin peptidase)/N-methyltransferase [Azospirillum rugosum]